LNEAKNEWGISIATINMVVWLGTVVLEGFNNGILDVEALGDCIA
jgi:uncharacterized membrane protein (DUF485 family)